MVEPQDLLDRAAAADDLAGLLKQGIGGAILAVGISIASGILTVADLVILPLSALGEELAETISAIFGVGDIIDAGTEATAQSLTGSFNVGPATFALSIASVLLGFYIISRYLAEDETSNIGLFGTGIDVPTPGFGDAEEEEEG